MYQVLIYFHQKTSRTLVNSLSSCTVRPCGMADVAGDALEDPPPRDPTGGAADGGGGGECLLLPPSGDTDLPPWPPPLPPLACPPLRLLWPLHVLDGVGGTAGPPSPGGTAAAASAVAAAGPLWHRGRG